MKLTHLTRVSTNKKTGPIPVSTSSRKNCPSSCPFKNNGCYAESGPIRIHWNHVTEETRGDEWKDFLDSIRRMPKGQLWRHNQAGDLWGNNNKINLERLKELVAANKGRKGFTYTHYAVTLEDFDKKSTMPIGLKKMIVKHNQDCVRFANDNGFTVNISGNSPDHAKKLRELKIGPVVTVVSEDFETNTDIVICPADGEYVNCASCQLCQKQHNKIIGFQVHGTSKKKAGQIVESY